MPYQGKKHKCPKQTKYNTSPSNSYQDPLEFYITISWRVDQPQYMDNGTPSL